jgi:uncharacterized protein (DUF4415 family)
MAIRYTPTDKPPAKKEAPARDQRADEFFGNGKKPEASGTTMISIRLPNELLEAYKKGGSGYQKRIIDVLLASARKEGLL